MRKQQILTEIDAQGVATVTLNRPEKHNAFDDAIIAELQTAFELVNKNTKTRVMILSAKGKSFSAGADLSWMQAMAGYSYQENLDDATALAEMLRTLNTMAIPTIARVQGAAFGGAVGLVSCCDMAIGTSRASFCLSEVKIGLIPATISPYVISAIGQRAARRYFLSAERFSADKAVQLGLLSEIVEEEELDQRIIDLCNTLMGNGPSAIRAAKQLIFDVANQEISDHLIADTGKRIASIRVSHEGQEGLSAFLEKRPASWTEDF